MRSIFLLLLVSFFSTSAQTVIDSSDVRYLALGDSYTIGASVSTAERWPVQLKDSLEVRGYTFDRFKIIAQTGWTTTSLLNAVDGENLTNDWNLVSILIGVNNQYQKRPFSVFLSELPMLINKAIALAGNDTSRVFLVSIPDYAYTPFGQSFADPSMISQEIDQYNLSMDSIALAYNIQYVSITAITRKGLEDENLVANDGLHPSGLAYTEFVKTLLKELDSEKEVTSALLPEREEIRIQRVGVNLTVSVPITFGVVQVKVHDLEGKEWLNVAAEGESTVGLQLQKFVGKILLVSVYRGDQQLKTTKIMF